MGRIFVKHQFTYSLTLTIRLLHIYTLPTSIHSPQKIKFVHDIFVIEFNSNFSLKNPFQKVKIGGHFWFRE